MEEEKVIRVKIFDGDTYINKNDLIYNLNIRGKDAPGVEAVLIYLGIIKYLALMGA